MSQNRLTILHVDMDAFYASVEQTDRPELRGKPVIVGGSAEHRGVVSAASYEVRAFGVHSAMPMITAQRLCPQAVVLPVRIKHYAEVARQIHDIFRSFTPLVQPLSLDEAFLDIGGCEGLFGSATEIGRKIKDRIKNETNLIASVGVAGNMFLAKLASDLEKPDGFVVIEPDNVRTILDPLPVTRLWGVGAKAEKRLHKMGLRTIGQIAALSENEMASRMGDVGRHLWRLANGIDDRAVTPDERAKTLSTETTFPRDIGDRTVLRSCLLELVQHLSQRIRIRGVKTQIIELKIRTSDFQTFNRSVSLKDPTDLTEEIWQAAANLFERRVSNTWLPVRLLGVGASGLAHGDAVQADLFDNEWRARQASLDQTLDAIRAQFGTDAIRRGVGLDRTSTTGGP